MISFIQEPLFARGSETYARIAGRKIRQSTLNAARIAIGYLIIGSLWMFLFDLYVHVGDGNANVANWAEVTTDWIFLCGTAGVLFWAIRRNLEEKRRQLDMLELFIEYAPAALAMVDRKLHYRVVSRAWASVHGLGKDDLRGRSHLETFPGLSERWTNIYDRGLAGETLRKNADQFERPDGSVIWIRWEVRPWLDAAGAIGGIVMFTEDITARKKAEDALVDSQEKLRLALECGRVGTWSWDLETGALDCDDSLAQMCGFSREQLQDGGTDFFVACVHPDDRPSVESAMAKVQTGSNHFVAEYRMIRPDGKPVWIADRGRVERSTSGEPRRMFGASVDVTELKNTERTLRETEERFQEVVDTIHEVFWVFDVANKRVLYVSPGYEKIWGRRAADIYASPGSWMDAIHPDDRNRVREASVAKIETGAYDQTYRVIRPDGSLRWVRDHAYPVRDAAGRLVRFVGTASDVTDRKKLEEQFLHAQRMEAIGTLASGVAHDLNNILAPMMMAAPLLRAKLTDPADMGLATIVERSAERGAGVVRQLLTFSRGTSGEKGPVQMRHLVKEMNSIMAETFPREIGISSELPSDLWPVLGDATQLHQVLMNLTVNARDAMPHGGRLVVKAENSTLNAEEAIIGGRSAPGRYIKLTVSDTGEGIPPEIRARIFEPFFTTKPVGKGTGLGLSTVMAIIKGHNGLVSLESEPGQGTSFLVYLPCAENSALPVVKSAPKARPVGNGDLILVVEDEPAVRMVMTDVLERYGYKVLQASNGREGLASYLLQQAHIKAVVTDLMMPEMGGLAFVQALREFDAALPLLAATGLQEGADFAILTEYKVELLPKPYTPTELLMALERAMKSPSKPPFPVPDQGMRRECQEVHSPLEPAGVY